MLTGEWGGVPGAAEQTGLRRLEQMVPQIPPISDLLCQVLDGLPGRHAPGTQSVLKECFLND